VAVPARAVEDIPSSDALQTALTILAGQFGHLTAKPVSPVTNPIYDPARDEHEQYREHITASTPLERMR
jgi:hypothetical protein